MSISSLLYRNFVEIMRLEMIPALGCTEPIAIAFAAAKAREVLGAMPEQMTAHCSGNIVKNVKGVVVPGSDGMKGIEAAASLGAIGGDAAKELEVLSTITKEHIAQAREFIAQKRCSVALIPDSEELNIIVSAKAGQDTVEVEVYKTHTNIIRITRNGKEILSTGGQSEENLGADLYAGLSVRAIYDFANEVKLDDVRSILAAQVECNVKISQEGLTNPYGASVGQTILAVYGSDIKTRARAKAAAGADARMSGCKLPVVINSGSGNQGITVSIPVIEYAGELGVSEETLYRALCLSNLISIHIKHGIGVLSAYCGAVSAACGSGAGIAYLHGEDFTVISHSVINMLANVSGIFCDGAKPSCAAKIAAAVDAAIMGYHMAKAGRVFASGDGIVKNDVEATIAAIAEIGRVGMHGTDLNILDIMIRDSKKSS